MNGPQIKTVLERAYRNYWYYNYKANVDPKYGGYSYYTTCMLDTDKNNVITYADMYPAEPNGNNVVSLKINGTPVDFSDATKFYNVSTVNYLAAGSCNFNDAGVSLWPLNQIVADTQLYVRDAVIDYVKAQTGPISPKIEGRLAFPNGVTLEPVSDAKTDYVGKTVQYTLHLTNVGNAADTYQLTIAGNKWTTTLPATVGPLDAGASTDVIVQVSIPTTAAHNATDSVTVTAKSAANPTKSASSALTTKARKYLYFFPIAAKN